MVLASQHPIEQDINRQFFLNSVANVVICLAPFVLAIVGALVVLLVTWVSSFDAPLQEGR